MEHLSWYGEAAVWLHNKMRTGLRVEGGKKEITSSVCILEGKDMFTFIVATFEYKSCQMF